jgi:general secretion pathway protein B
MSYILEALKKAESERKLGSVPNMHAQPLAAASAGATPLWRNPILWSALVALLLIAVAIAWFAPWRADRPSADIASVASLPQQTSSGSVDMQAKPEQPPAAPQIPAPQTAAPQAAAPAASPPVSRETPLAQSASSRALAQDASPAEPAKPKPAAKKKSEPEKAPVASEAAARKAELAATAPAQAQESYVPSARELPENIQREIPALTVGGYIYSSVPAERSVLINNRLLREGSEIAPGLMLEKMLPKEAVLNYRGYRYRIPY